MHYSKAKTNESKVGFIEHFVALSKRADLSPLSCFRSLNVHLLDELITTLTLRKEKPSQ